MKYLQQTNICRRSSLGDEVVLQTEIFTNPIENITSHYRFSPILTVQLSEKGKQIFSLGCEENHCYQRKKIEIRGKVSEISGVWSPIGSQTDQRNLTKRSNLQEFNNTIVIGGNIINRMRALINSSSCKIVLMEEGIIIHTTSKPSVFSPIWMILKKVYLFRDRVVELFYSHLPSQHAGLAVGVLLGVKSRLDQDFYNELVATGTLHVISASGYNIAVVVAVVVQFLKKLMKKQWAILLSILFILLYVILAGSSPAVIRAGIMGVISSLGIVTGRVYSAKWALFLSSMLMLVYSPLFLLDISFQLSVSATFGILSVYPKINEWMKKATRRKKQSPFLQELIDASLTTTSASMMTIPIILIHFGRLSVIAIVANTFLLWLVPYIMLFSALFLFIGMIHPFLAFILSFFVWSSAEIFIQLIHFFGMIPFAQIEIEHGQWMGAIGVYILIYYVVFRSRKKAKNE